MDTPRLVQLRRGGGRQRPVVTGRTPGQCRGETTRETLPGWRSGTRYTRPLRPMSDPFYTSGVSEPERGGSLRRSRSSVGFEEGGTDSPVCDGFPGTCESGVEEVHILLPGPVLKENSEKLRTVSRPTFSDELKWREPSLGSLVPGRETSVFCQPPQSLDYTVRHCAYSGRHLVRPWSRTPPPLLPVPRRLRSRPSTDPTPRP